MNKTFFLTEREFNVIVCPVILSIGAQAIAEGRTSKAAKGDETVQRWVVWVKLFKSVLMKLNVNHTFSTNSKYILNPYLSLN